MWILTLDGGGSKTLACLTNTATNQQWQQQAGPASLTNDFELAINHIQQLSQTLCQQAGVATQQVITVMGLAGAGNPQQHQQAMQLLQSDYQQLLITTDARTSLYGANLGQPVLVVALGAYWPMAANSRLVAGALILAMRAAEPGWVNKSCESCYGK